MTPGFRSTEFWLSAACSVAGLAVGASGFWLGHDLVYVGSALLIASVASYGHSRGKAKGRPYLPPGGRL